MGEMLLNGRLYGASGIRELTQAQYDALPASKLTDGVLYCIKDTGIVEGDKYAPIIYSLEEREVGVWTDGKPLYQKTIEITSIASGAEKSFAHGISNIDVVVDCKGYAYNGNDHKSFLAFIVPNDINSNTSGINGRYIFAISNADRTNIVCAIGSGLVSQLTKLVFTIRYTKTTDVPGSGTWGTDGVPMVHYDGTERIIGTWFGETLYEIVVDGLNISIPSNWGTEFITSLSIKDAISAKFWDASNSTNPIMLSIDEVQVLNGGIRIRSQQSDIVNYRHITRVVIQYTKTT